MLVREYRDGRIVNDALVPASSGILPAGWLGGIEAVFDTSRFPDRRRRHRGSTPTRLLSPWNRVERDPSTGLIHPTRLVQLPTPHELPPTGREPIRRIPATSQIATFIVHDPFLDPQQIPLHLRHRMTSLAPPLDLLL